MEYKMLDTISKEVIIIGGGPAGLKCAEEAQKHKIDYIIVERGEVGQAWKEIRPDMPMLSPCHPQRDWTSLSNRQRMEPKFTLEPFGGRSRHDCDRSSKSMEMARTYGGWKGRRWKESGRNLPLTPSSPCRCDQKSRAS